jgi:hypothetical protein
MGLASSSGAAPLQGAPSPNYDEQLGTTFTQDFSSLAYNVTALAQADADGYGPGYLLNGVTPEGYWYQVGVSYHWPNSDGSYDPGFGFSYQVYGPTGNGVDPTKGAGLGAFSGVVNSGDTVLLSLNFSRGSVVMRAQDWNTGAAAQTSYSGEGALAFVGDAFAPVSSHGFFTGLMTEWYHSAAYTANEGQVAYTNANVALTSAWMWIDEFDTSTTAPALFDNQTKSPVTISDDQVYPFAAEGATMYISAHRFVTGLSGASSTLTLTPATAQTSSPGFSANFTLAGKPQLSVLHAGANVLEADPGTEITVAINSSGSSGLQWVFDENTGATASLAAGANRTYVYYEVAQEMVSYSIAGGGQAPPSKPEFVYQVPPDVQTSPSPVTVPITQPLGTTPAVIYAVVGTVASVNGTILGTPGERWATNAENWTISSPNEIPSPIQFYQQYDVSVGYSVVGGGTPLQTPEFDSTAFGGQAVISLINNATKGWFDSGSDYSFTSVLNGSMPSERWWWVGTGNSSSLSSPNERLVAIYDHQFYVSVGVNDPSGGSLTVAYPGAPIVIAGQVPSSWLLWLNTGSILNAAPSASQGWQFENWRGSGTGAYSGANSSIDVTVTGPLSENATFYPQLAISADGGTDIAYSYGSATGTVPAGTTKTLYVPPSTNVTLRATPSLFVYSFGSWQATGLAKATKPSLVLVVDSPSSVTGTSTLALPVLLGLLFVAAIVVILAASVLVRSRRRRAEIYGFNPS